MMIGTVIGFAILVLFGLFVICAFVSDMTSALFIFLLITASVTVGGVIALMLGQKEIQKKLDTLLKNVGEDELNGQNGRTGGENNET